MINKNLSSKKGITLVALVVTIVILIILAGVALTLVLGNSGILQRTKDAKTNYTNSSAEEGQTLANLEQDIGSYLGESGGTTSGGETLTISQAQDSTTMLAKTEKSAVKDVNNNTFEVPAGFYVTNDETDTTKGIVITDGTNEFVWIPVADATTLYQTIPSTALSGTTATTIKSSASGIISGQTRGITGSTTCREPDILNNSSYDLNSSYHNGILGYADANAMATAFVADYEAMIASVNTNKGFYVGRYELTGTVDKPTEKAGTTLANINWYNLYKACKAVKSTSYAQTSMIWGCQWDTVCNWLISTGAKTSDEVNKNSSSWGNYNGTSVKASDGTTEIKASGTSSVLQTGVTTFTKANNIYDIAGNCWEWTQEAYYTNGRVNRGGSYSNSGSSFPASYRCYFSPSLSNSLGSSRAVLYIK